MKPVFWAPRKPQFCFEEVEAITVLFDPLSNGSHFLSGYHLALLDQLPALAADALSMDDLARRVAAANDVEDEDDLQQALSAALHHLQKEALVESRVP